MSDTKVPNAPDYSPMITAFQNIADSAKQTGADSLAWAKEQVANNKDLLDQVNKGLLDTQGTFGQAAKDTLAKSGAAVDTGMANLKDQYAKYTDPARKAADMGAAGATAAQADEAARAASTRELESYGVNPGAVRFGGLDAAARLQSAATRVGAENIAGRTDDALADQTNAQILAQGNAEAGQANQNAATGTSAGGTAVTGANQTTSTGGGVLGTGLQWTGAGTNALTGATSATNTGFQNQADADKISNSSSSGLGTLAGLGLSAMGKGGALASGGALAFLEDGGAVPLEASPSNGAATDDVTASGPGGNGAIRLNAGEFVIPKDVVSWEGEKSLQKLIQKAREAKQEATAKPRQQAPGGPDPASPAFQPRPQAQGALPV
jgi:hypothetical protein